MHGMMKFFSNFKEFYNDINGATLTGAIDVIVVEQKDESFSCSPFHVRFGKLGVLRSKEKVVDIEINGEPQEIHMKLGESGEAFFVEELEEDDDNEVPEHLATSPISVSDFESMFKNQTKCLSFEDISTIDLENQENDYIRRRNTADNENSRIRERNFLRKHLGLGNLDIGENSAEEMTLSIISGKHSSDDLSNETTFKMDNLDFDNAKTDEQSSKANVPSTPVKKPETDIKDSELASTLTTGENKSAKKKRRRTRRKNIPKKSTSVNQLSSGQASETIENNDSVTDRSSLESNGSDPDLQNKSSKSDLKMETSNIKKIDADFHFFSDTEITNNGTTDSPTNVEVVQSDSEIEVKGRKEDALDGTRSWEWGRFPSVSQASSPVSDNPRQEEHRSMLSGMFSFMKQKHATQNPLDGGMYLSDITSGTVDQEVAEIYFSTNKDKKDVDCESGNGPSLTQSPNSADGCKSIDSDFEEQQKLAQAISQDISLSLCGWDPEPNCHRFLEHVVKFSDLCNSPILFENPKLVVRIKDKYYTWKVAAPIITSIMVYGRPLVQSSVEQLCNMHMPIRTDVEQKEGPKQEARRSWWSGWRRTGASRETTPAPENTVDIEVPSENKNEKESKEVKVIIENEEEKNVIPRSASTSSEKYRKTLRLTSKQISKLNLRDGMNEVEFSITTAYQGTSRCQCHLYKWRWDDKIVVSDIDGTITKSDVLGHILPIMGKDWAQTGVAQLFNKIEDNGYKLLYLSARAIGQARLTRDYLKSIKQGDISMPDGPILLNPTSLITAFRREVIERKPEQFKISCMSDIKALFPADSNPFYAGYGNKINDVWAYRAVGIPIVRIFTINPRGELKHELTETFQSTYSNMSVIVDQLFPSRLEAANDYSQNVYWRDPVPPIEELPEI